MAMVMVAIALMTIVHLSLAELYRLNRLRCRQLGKSRISQETTEEFTLFEPNSLTIQVLEEQRENLLPLLQQEAQRALNTQQAISIGDLEIMNL